MIFLNFKGFQKMPTFIMNFARAKLSYHHKIRYIISEKESKENKSSATTVKILKMELLI